MNELDGAHEFRRVVRGILGSAPEAAVPGRLLDQGYADFLSHDAHAAIHVLFDEVGQADSCPPVLDLVAAFALDLPPGPAPVVGYPDLRDRDSLPPAEQIPAGIRFTALAFGDPSRADRVLVPARLAGEPALIHAPCSAVTWSPTGAFAPDLHLTAALGAAGPLEVLDLATDRWQRFVTMSQVALAYDLLGLAERISRLTVAHVCGRNQFGRPLAARQAVKHRMADVTVAIAAARGVLAAGPLSDPLLGRAGKALAGRAALLASAQALQLHGATGFSSEYVLHRLVRRVHVLDSLLGSSAWHKNQLGRLLTAGARVPALVEL
jgi:hypothetical protein